LHDHGTKTLSCGQALVLLGSLFIENSWQKSQQSPCIAVDILPVPYFIQAGSQ